MVEQAGLVKFDFLGLKTLTMLRCCTDLLKARGIEIDLASLPLDDPRTYEPMGRGETVGVFPGGIGGHAQGAVRDAGRPVRGHHRPRRPVPAGPDGQHPRVLRA